MTSPYAFEPRRVDKPWGYELIWAHAEQYVGKVLFVRAGQALSLQYHEEKDESWLVQSGPRLARARRGRRRADGIPRSARAIASATDRAPCIA